MIVEKTIMITLKESEYTVLKNLLGNMNDDEYKEFAITGKDRELIREIWDSIPYKDDE